MVRLDYIHRFGYYCTESSEHNAEYNMFYMKSKYPELIEQYNIPLDEYPRRCVNQIANWAKERDEMRATHTLDHQRSRGQGDKSTDLYVKADRFAKTLRMVKVAELNEKEDNDAIYSDADFIVDEKAKTATLTPNGVKKAEAYFGVENLTDPDNITLQHHVNQAIKARGCYGCQYDGCCKQKW